MAKKVKKTTAVKQSQSKWEKPQIKTFKIAGCGLNGRSGS